MLHDSLRDWLGRTVDVTIDRPMGSEHPDGGLTYPVNYGYVPGTLAGDGEEIDAYLLGPEGPVAAASGRVVAVVLRADDVEGKLVVHTGEAVPAVAAIEAAVAFEERYFDSTVVPLATMRDPAPGAP